MNSLELKDWLVRRIAETLRLDPSTLDVREPFASYGISSAEAVGLSGDLEELLGRKLPATLAYEYPTIVALAEHLGGSAPASASMAGPDAESGESRSDIAIIGMGCRFPGAKDPREFWRLLQEGRDAIREVPPDRWDARRFYHPDGSLPGKSISRWGGFLDRVDQFDPHFFGISPGEAERMDPQQRLLLELAYESFEDAGYPLKRLAGMPAGVFVGISANEYGVLHYGQYDLLTGHSGTGNALSIAANRISYFFDLHGPSMAVDTACSSSLAAVHLACRSLRSGESGLAVAGGVNIILSPAHSIAFTKAGVLARDGRCKVFDARADGYVRGEGGGLVVLKPLPFALRDGDRIYATIRGSAMVQDGRTNGLMAPSREAQEELLRAAYRDARLSPAQVAYVEAHGTGTLLGDSIEARALGAVLAPGRSGTPCKVGSVKSNFGHLEAAAGVAGLIKVALSLKERAIPPSLHFSTPNPHVPFSDLGLEVQRTSASWPNCKGSPVAGISSFGFGGTNVHVVLEGAPVVEPETPGSSDAPEPDTPSLLPLSGKCPEALGAAARALRAELEDPSSGRGYSVRDRSRCAAVRGNHLEHRMAVVGRSRQELLDQLEQYEKGATSPDVLTGSSSDDEQGRLVFVFSGQGSQWAGMGRELLAHEPIFRAAIEQCDRAFKPYVDWSLLDLLDGTSERTLGDIDVVQPALFAMQVALASLWQSWGIRPGAVVGHSMGEVAAATVAEALSLEDAARVICLRSKILRRLSGQGGMAVVGLSAEETVPFLEGNGANLSVAAVNSPRTTVVAGEKGALQELVAALEKKGVFAALVNVDVASHSPQTAPLGGELRRCLEGIRPRAAKVPFVSTVTGSALEGPLLVPEYWSRNITEPVRFADGVSWLLAGGYRSFLEISPHPILQSSVQQGMIHLSAKGVALASIRREDGERRSLLRSVGALYASGRIIDWEGVYPSRGRFVPLPPYPWQRRRYWLDGHCSEQRTSTSRGGHPLLGDRVELGHLPDALVWQNRLDRSSPGFLREHRVNGEPVVPAAAFIEMALSAAAGAGVSHSHTLADLEFLQPLPIPEGGTRFVQISLSSEGGDVRRLHLHSKGSDPGDTWTLHVTANFRPKEDAGHPESADSMSLAQLRARCTRAVSPGELYRALAESGLEYGPNFRGVEGSWTDGREALGRIALPGGGWDDSERYLIHPALLDAALQVSAVALLPSADRSDRGGTYLPGGCRKITIHGRLGVAIWSHVAPRPEAGAGGGNKVVDLRLLDDAGRCVAEFDEVRFMRSAQKRMPARTTSAETWHYAIRWQEAGWPEPGAALKGRQRWVILADQRGVGEALRRILEEQGDNCELLYRPAMGVGAPVHRIDRTKELWRFLRERFESEREPLGGVIHLWGSEAEGGDPDSGNALALAQAAGGDAAVGLVQVLASRSGTLGMPQLWLVTSGAQGVSRGERPSLAQVPILGLAKSVALELPELRCKVVDLDPLSDPQTAAELLARQLSIDDAEDQVALRKDGRFVPRLVPLEISLPGGDPSAPSQVSLRPDASYLITGGLGALGLAAASWMVRQGARHLVLLGRREPSEKAAEAVETLRRAGARVEIVTGDVARDGDLVRAVEKVVPPLRGVLHAAGILENAPILNLDAGVLSRVMASKVEGAWNLHAATLSLPLDFFVLFSSAVSVLGSPGQANYAAANAFLDGLARYRRATGLPALSINWGPWADFGLAREGRYVDGEGAGSMGLKGIRSDHGLEVLGRAIRSELDQLVALPFDLRALLDLYPAAARLPFFSEVGGKETHVSRLYARPSLRQAYVAPRNSIELKLAELWRQTLRVDRVGVRDSFFELGGDSVLGAQIVTRARQAFGVDLDLRDAFKAFTIEAIAERIESALLESVENLSESEAERLLEG